MQGSRGSIAWRVHVGFVQCFSVSRDLQAQIVDAKLPVMLLIYLVVSISITAADSNSRSDITLKLEYLVTPGIQMAHKTFGPKLGIILSLDCSG